MLLASLLPGQDSPCSAFLLVTGAGDDLQLCAVGLFLVPWEQVPGFLQPPGAGCSGGCPAAVGSPEARLLHKGCVCCCAGSRGSAGDQGKKGNKDTQVQEQLMCLRERGAGASVATAAGEQLRPVSENVRLPKMLRSKGHVSVAAWSHGVRLWGRGSSAPRPIPPRGRRSAPPRLGAGDAPRANPAVSHGEASREGAARLNQNALR